MHYKDLHITNPPLSHLVGKARLMVFRNISAAGMLPRRHITLAVAVGIAGWLLAADARAQGAGDRDEALARQAYQLAANWAHRADVPDSSPPIRMSNIAAVHVTLRRDGATLGRATVTAAEIESAAEGTEAAENSADPQQKAAPPADKRVGTDSDEGRVDVMRMIRPAVKAALRETAGTMRRPIDLPRIAPELMLDLQLARPPQRIEISHLRELPARLTVSRDGLAMRRADRWAWLFPGTAIATNASLKGQLNRLLGKLDLPPDQLEVVGQPAGPPLYRFEVIHLVRPSVGQPVRRLQRGNVLLPTTSLDDAALKDLAAQLAGHLIRRQRSSGRFAGSYEPTADRYQPVTAAAIDAARAAFALARRARLSGLTPEQRQSASEAAHRAADMLAERWTAGAASGRGRLAELGPKAMALLAVLEVPSPDDRFAVVRERLASDLQRMQRSDGSFHAAARSGARPAPLSSQALAAAAMVQLFDRNRDPQLLDRARRALDHLWKGMDERRFIQCLPWLSYAEATLVRLGRPSPHRQELIEFSGKLWERQVMPWSGENGEKPSPDTIGGFLLGGTILEEPTAESAEALAAEALVLRAGELVGQEAQPRWLYRCGLAARFLAQLAMQPSSAYYTRNRPAAIGGVRFSFVNNRQSLESTATALLAVTELQHALENITKQQTTSPE